MQMDRLRRRGIIQQVRLGQQICPRSSIGQSVGLRSRRLQVRLLSGIISLHLSSQEMKRLEKPTTEWKPAAEYPLVSSAALGTRGAAQPGLEARLALWR